MGVLLGIIFLGVLILVHEFGHMNVARWLGVRVRSFCIGIGKGPIRRLSWTSKRSGTVYGVAPLPIGGMVDLKGMLPPKPYEKMDRWEKAAHDKAEARGDVAEPLSEDPTDDNFYTKPYWKKALILLAGPATNLFMGWLVLLFVSLAFTQVPSTSTVLGSVEAGSPAARAGIQAGDSLVAFRDATGVRQPITAFEGIGEARDAGATAFWILHGGQEHLVTVVPTVATDGSGRKVLGIRPVFRSATAAEGIRGSFSLYGTLMREMVKGYRSLFSGQAGPIQNALAGPVGIIRMTSGYVDNPAAALQSASGLSPGEVQQEGWYTFLVIWAFISINLGLVNLLPVPPLDGGKVVEEAFAPLLRRYEGLRQGIRYASLLIMLALMTLMLLVTVNDITRIFHS